jgi:uncharacterized protein YprB with RNaseH-like and TPR domain
MIRRTFQLLSGIGPWREKDLWTRGIQFWDDFPADGAGIGISEKVDRLARDRIDECRTALAGHDLSQLAKLLPPREHWRLYAEFAEEALFFDVEADGASAQQPSVVSVYDSSGLGVFLRGRNLEDLPARLSGRKLWVTFNGSCFDVPILRNYFETLQPPPVHLDLRFLAQRVGITGGLKDIEEQVGIARPPHLRGLNGWDAVGLWRTYQQEHAIEALRFLVEYNLYDAFQLRSLASILYNRAADRLACDERVEVFDRGELLYDVSKLLLALDEVAGGPSRDLAES